MKSRSTLTFIAAISLFCLNLSAQVPNAGFENWTSGIPDNWFTSNISSIATPVTQFSPGHTGVCAKGQPVFSSVLNDTVAPFIYSGNVGLGFPITQAYATLEFYYQCNLTAGDLFSAVVVIYDASYNIIAASSEDIPTSVSGWTHIAIPINYISSGAANAAISFTLLPNPASSATQPALTSTFLIDDVSLTGLVAITEIMEEADNAFVYPNPANNVVSVSLHNSANGKAEITVYDLLGNAVKKISSERTSSRFEHKFSVADLRSGIYPVRITSGSKQWIAKIVKQ
jgi:hypothetical protein